MGMHCQALLQPALDLCLMSLGSASECFLGSKCFLRKCLAELQNELRLFFYEIYNRLSTPSDNRFSWKSAGLYRYHQSADVQAIKKGRNQEEKSMYHQGNTKFAKFNSGEIGSTGFVFNFHLQVKAVIIVRWPSGIYFFFFCVLWCYIWNPGPSTTRQEDFSVRQTLSQRTSFFFLFNCH